jgi:hypothetical protein
MDRRKKTGRAAESLIGLVRDTQSVRASTIARCHQIVCGVHSVIAGRGNNAREFRVMYGERDWEGVISRAVVCLGPGLEIDSSFTRARYRLVLFNSHRSAPTAVIGEAAKPVYIDTTERRGERRAQRR